MKFAFQLFLWFLAVLVLWDVKFLVKPPQDDEILES